MFHFSFSTDQGNYFNYSTSFTPEEYLILGQHQKLTPGANQFYFGKLAVLCYHYQDDKRRQEILFFFFSACPKLQISTRLLKG